MSNVATLNVGSRIHPAGVLEAARSKDLKKVIVVGWTQEGHFYFNGSESIEQTIYLLRNAEHELFKEMDADEQ